MWKSTQEKLDGKKITVRDFDSWLGGYIIAIFSFGVLTEIDLREIVDVLVFSKIAKSIGVVGTDLESIEFYQTIK